MNYKCGNSKFRLTAIAICFAVFATMSFAAQGNMKQIPNGEKAKVKGKINSRNGDLVYVTDVKDGSNIAVNITDNTKIDRKKGKHTFLRKSSMDVTAMVPGLTIEAEGVGNAKGQLDAAKISFYPDTFSIEVAEEQQIMANKAAAGRGAADCGSGRSQGERGPAIGQYCAGLGQHRAEHR